MTTTVVNNSLFRTIFEKQKLTGNNFMEWYRNLWIVLSTEDKLPFLEQPIHVLLVPPTGQANPLDVVTTHQAWVKGQKEIARLMLMTMDPDIQKNLEHLGAFDMLNDLKTLKDPEKLEEENHIRLLRGIKGKAKLRWAMHLCRCHLLLPNPRILQHPRRIIQQRTRYATNVVKWVTREGIAPFILDLMKKKKLSQGASTSGIFTIELYSFPSTSWVYDTGCGNHICITTQGLRGSKKLKLRALSLYVGDGHHPAVEAIGEYHLCLPSGLVLILHNCHYAPSITRRIILVSRLYKDGFVNHFETDNLIFLFKNNMIYFNVIPQDDIYEIVMSSSNANDSSMYAVSNKRAKLNLDSALLWRCRLRHINKKRIKKLQDGGLLDSTHIKSFEKCVACMSGEMARKPYSHQVKRAKDLLGLVHTDNAEFLENSFIAKEASGSLEDLEIIQEEDTHPSIDTSLDHEEDDQEIGEPQSDINPICRSKRTRRAPDRICLYIDAEEHELGDLGAPANYKAALLDPESDKWLNAMNVKMQSMKDNDVWELVELPPDAKTIGHKRLFKNKTDMDGVVHTYKARQVAKGFTQTPRIDYEETFSPVTDIRAIRILLDT
nr:retrotransposon protein, putative, Ty1-copia subclass [Tanacetum cinerariifolium]